MTRIICVASVVYFKIRFFFEIYYHENSNFPFAAGLLSTFLLKTFSPFLTPVCQKSILLFSGIDLALTLQKTIEYKTAVIRRKIFTYIILL
ncbi:hypothetical protein IYZ83_003815 [Wolbachia pipientis]|uniref:hypothetical protein n=1 Tax=Wolbachia pipientis TaxID=955 RepID=UPI001BDAF05D|nr:hypothetical protein [Wolbachia pipientis]UIP91281.1 hypothetical protein IYZ83_003815 [Wolbachia pipientis]